MHFKFRYSTFDTSILQSTIVCARFCGADKAKVHAEHTLRLITQQPGMGNLMVVSEYII